MDLFVLLLILASLGFENWKKIIASHCFSHAGCFPLKQRSKFPSCIYLGTKNKPSLVVGMAELVEGLSLKPDVHGLNPVIIKIYIQHVYCSLYCKDDNKEKEEVNDPFKGFLDKACCNHNIIQNVITWILLSRYVKQQRLKSTASHVALRLKLLNWQRLWFNPRLLNRHMFHPRLLI